LYQTALARQFSASGALYFLRKTRRHLSPT